MDVSSAAKTQALLRALQNPEASKEALQVGLLKKTLDAQKEEAATLLQQLSGKGQIIDIRV